MIRDPSVPSSPRSILIVEDNPITRSIVTRYFEVAGLRVDAAESGEEALAILRAHGPAIDWLFTDICLSGGISGWIVGAEFNLNHPLRPVIYALVRNRSDYGRVVLLYGARAPGDLLYETEYDAWRAAGIDVQVIVNVGTAEWRGAIGFVTTPLANLSLDPARTAVFACGPEPMMRFVAGGAVGRGVSADRVFVSLERNMNCAVGLCEHCQLGPMLICRDGAVFPAGAMQRLMEVREL